MEFSTHQSENASWLKQLEQVRALKLQLKKGYPIGDIISKIGGQTISSYPHSAETLDAIATDYELMMNYMLTGMADPSRAELYAQYVSDMALLSLDSQEQQDVTSRDIASRHQQFLSETFINIVGSAQWSHELASDMLALILSPTIDSIDAQLLISAIMMGALFVADVEKVLTLMCIYEQAQSEKLRQRALVGWAFC